MQEFIGFEHKALRYNKEYEISDRALVSRHFTDVDVGPLRPTIDGNFLEELAGGAFDEAGQLIDACLQARSEQRNAIKTTQKSIPATRSTDRLDQAVFGGILFDHFGHFLLETTSRLWALADHPEMPWVFLTSLHPQLRPYQRDFLQLLGLAEDRIVVVSDWMRVEQLIIPEPAFVYHHWAAKRYLDAFRASKLDGACADGRRIFLSRSDATMALTIGERELEDILLGEGWDIVVPEQLPASEQARLFRDDNVVMGLQGSAMHLGLFAPPGRKVVHLCRGQGYRGYYILDDLTGADATYFYAMRSHELASKPITGPFRLDLDATIGFLRSKGLISSSRVAVSAIGPEASAQLDADYVAWWHFTESQTRFHLQTAHDGSPADRSTSLEFALLAATLRPEIPKILCHALALTLKFDGVEAAIALAERSQASLSLSAISDPQLLYMMALIRDLSGEPEASVDAAERCVDLAPTNPTYVNQLATSLFRLHRLEEAEACVRRIIAEGHAAAENLFLLSLVLHSKGELPTAVEWALKATASDRSNRSIATHAANLLIAQDRLEEAVAIYADLIERIPDKLGILRDLVDLETRLGHSEQARLYLFEAYRLCPSDREMREQCAAALRTEGWMPELDIARRPTPAECEQALMIYMQSRSLQAAGVFDGAVRTAIKAFELNPGNQTIMEHLVAAMLTGRRLLQAHILSHTLIEAGLGTGNIHYLVSLIESDLGRRDAAHEAARRAAELEPGNDVIGDHYQRLLVS